MAEKNVAEVAKQVVGKLRGKITRSSSVTFWSLLVQIGGGRGHRRQVVVFDTLLKDPPTPGLPKNTSWYKVV